MSEPHHLATILHPSIILFFIMLNYFLKNLKPILRWPILYRTIIVSFFLVTFGYIYWNPVNFIRNISIRMDQRYNQLKKPYYFWNYYGTNIYLTDDNGRDFAKSVNIINKYSPNTKNVLILSRYDTLLLTMSQKASLMDYFILEYDSGTIVTLYEQLIQQIINEKPPVIFIRSKKYYYVFNDSIPGIWNKIKKYYIFAENGGVVDVYKLNINAFLN